MVLTPRVPPPARPMGSVRLSPHPVSPTATPEEKRSVGEADEPVHGPWTNGQYDVSPSLNSDKITESKEVKRWLDGYLGVGEWVMDQSIAVLGSSGYFERKR
ncbi:hypothetical protein MauCBS54593_007359 [Microsporum audouinii]